MDDQYTWMLSGCGEVQTDDPALLSLIAGFGDEKVLKLGDGEEAEYIELVAGSKSGRNKHLHIDISKPKVYGKGESPTPNSDESGIWDFLANFVGQKVKVLVSGRFVVPTNELPESGLIRSAMEPAKMGDMKITQLSATFLISGSPVNRIHWFSRKEGKEVRVELALEAETTVGADYLKRLHTLALGAFRSTVLGESDNATS